MRYDNQGRPVVSADWSAISDLPTIVKNLGNLATTAGGILISTDTAGTLNDLAIGSDGQILTVVSGLPAWEDAASLGLLSITDPSVSTERTSATLLIDDVLQLTVAAAAYQFDIFMGFYGTTTVFADFDLNGGSATIGSLLQGGIYCGSGGSPFVNAPAQTSPTYLWQIGLTTATSTTPNYINVRGTIVFSGAGTFGPRWSDSAGAGADVYRAANSYMVLTPLS